MKKIVFILFLAVCAPQLFSSAAREFEPGLFCRTDFLIPKTEPISEEKAWAPVTAESARNFFKNKERLHYQLLDKNPFHNFERQVFFYGFRYFSFKGVFWGETLYQLERLEEALNKGKDPLKVWGITKEETPASWQVYIPSDSVPKIRIELFIEVQDDINGYECCSCEVFLRTLFCCRRRPKSFVD